MITFEAMNTHFLLAGLSPAEETQIESLVQSAQTMLSRFEPGSELTRINKLGGQWVPATPLVFQLLKDATAAYRETDGLFNPFMGEILKELGYDKSFEQLPRPSEKRKHITSVFSTSSLSNSQLRLPSYLDFDERDSQVCLSPNVTLDLGGIAKGWIAQYAYNQLQLSGTTAGLIDAGGDIILWGQHPEQTLWGVGVAHPFDDNKDIADLWCKETTAIATSSVVKRRWQSTSNDNLHHIIDPRTQAPASSDFVQVTILARDLTFAEQYAKCLLILGSKDGLTWLQKKRSDLGYIAVCNDGCVIASNNLHEYCTELEVLPYVDLD